MAELIGALRVALGLDSAAFESGAKRAKTSLNSLEADFSKVGAAISRFAGIFGVALSAQALVQFAVQSVRLAADLGRAADMMGVTTRELQQMTFAFRDAGLSQEQFGQASLTLARNVADLQRGTGQLLQFLRESAPQFIENFQNARTLGDQYAVLADATASLASRHDQVRLAMAAGGESAQRLVPILERGGNTVRQLGTGFRELSADSIRAARDLEREFSGIIAEMQRQAAAFVVGTRDLFRHSSEQFNILMQGLRTRNRYPGLTIDLLRYIDAIRQAEEASARFMATMNLRGQGELADPRRFAAAAFEVEQLTSRLMGQRLIMDELSIGWNTHAAEVTRALALINAAHADSADASRARTRLENQLQLQQQQAMLQTATMAAQTITALFPKQKGAAIAAAVINTAVGITKALSEVPWPWNWVQAGLIAAQGIAQIAAIRSASPSGGGSAPSVSGGGGGAGGAGGGEGGGRAPTLISIQGIDPSDVFKGEQLINLIGQLNNAVSNGHVLISTQHLGQTRNT